MLTSYQITIELESGASEIFISPLLLQSKERPNLKSGNLEILYLYGNLRDGEYCELLQKEVLSEEFKSDKYVINCGQDFEKYYFGSVRVDFETKRCLEWDVKPGKLTERDVTILSEAIFDHTSSSRQVTMFTPTRPSDFNFGTTRRH